MPVTAPRLLIEERDALAGSDEIQEIWQAAEARCPDASPFVRWPWVSAWLREYGHKLSPRLLIWRRGEALAGVALIARNRVLRHRVFPVRQLFLNTAGEAGDNSVCVEYNQVLCAAMDQAAFGQAILSHLSRDKGWDELYLSGIAPERLPPALPSGAFRLDRQRPCYAMDLSLLRRQGRQPEDVLSGNTRHQIRRSLKLFGGRERLVLEEAGTAVEARAFLDEMVTLHQASWQKRGQSGAFGSGRLQRFLAHIIAADHPGSIQLLRLREGAGRTLGISCNLLGGGTVYYYQTGLLQLEDPRLKPGLCLHLLAMEHSLRQGRECYDFMASDMRYKQSLSNMQRTLLWGAIERPSLRLLAERWAVRAVRGVRGLRDTYLR